jgi:hypothetical protein
MYKFANSEVTQGIMNNENKTNWLERPIHPAFPAITNEILIFAGILLFAVITRFYDLESRVMSHDESLHTYFSWLLYRGQGYQHTPMMHGPLQFHMLAPGSRPYCSVSPPSGWSGAGVIISGNGVRWRPG